MSEKKKNIETTDVDILKTNKKSYKSKLVGIISLGCDKNRVDSEIMLTYLRDAGYRFTSDAANADIIIINTCGFIKNARNESMDTINEMSEYRRNPDARCQRLIVTGCMPQKWSGQMREDFPEVDIFLGIDQYPDIVQIIEKSFEKSKKIVKIGDQTSIPFIKDRMVTTPLHYAYLKIADGCENYCTFCTIPFIRGKYKSQSMENILDEAKSLVDNGASELILVAQDISRSGMDKSGKPQLVPLIKKLSKINNLKRIRLLYCYPEMVTDELIQEIVNNPKVCKYIDIPLQHIANPVLKRMNRRTTHGDIVNLLDKIQSQPVYIGVRTTLMVGFPGETEQDFEELCEFVQRYKLMHVGFFAYSKEEGTAAALLPGQLNEDIKRKRLLKLVRIQRKIAQEINNRFIGKTLEVCYEGIDYDRQLFFGRSEYQTPEADTLVFFKSKHPLEIGKYYKVKITKSFGYDLKGEVEEDE